ncbi:MAG: carboxysome shell protein [Candidatus Synechococcus spongiarum SP3]|uniref:Carboxysome shell carbonic anhydrase n=1 Tax=Candidatus Synechococcus spongiarum SP3 TaxID=1604020 RepID=A0A0G2HJY4_9SYNE|nr:MAG: carboxysome shell protein [Candidatus Synechococcus spongiarum SP3]
MPALRDPYPSLGPTAPRRRPPRHDGRAPLGALPSSGVGIPQPEQPVAAAGPLHPLTNRERNQQLRTYDTQVKSSFDKIVEVLKRISALQHDPDFEQKAQALALDTLGFSLPEEVLAKAWVTQLDMRSLFAWCVFETYKRTSEAFFASDPLGGQEDTAFDAFVRDCGFHLLDVSPCADGRLAHAISYALRLPFSSVRRRPYAGAMFDVERTVARWIKTEHRRHREGVPNQAHEDTRYLKVVVYHFSSLDPHHQGCAAHGSDDAQAARSGLNRLHDFRQAVENSFCCGASVILLLLGLDTDTDAIRIHVPTADGTTNLSRWLDAREVYDQTVSMTPEAARAAIAERVGQDAGGGIEEGMVRFISRLLENNISQIDFVRQFHHGAYGDAGHAERFIGVGIGFKEIHLRNLTYFAHMETVEEGAADLDVGIKIFKGLNISRGLPVPVVIRYDFHSSVPGSRERAVGSCERIAAAVHGRYQDLSRQGLLHTLLTVRDGDHHKPPEVLGSSLQGPVGEVH